MTDAPLDRRERSAVPRSMTRTAERMTVVVAILDAEPGLLTGELAERLGYDAQRLAPLLWRMEDEQRIVHEGRRWFAVIPD